MRVKKIRVVYPIKAKQSKAKVSDEYKSKM